jgi:protein gp37
MSDLFQGAFSDEQIAAVFGVMGACPRHIFQVLTKRELRLGKWHAHALTAIGPSGRPLGPAGWCNEAAVWATTEEGVFPKGLAGYRRDWPLPNVWQGVSVESRDYLSRIDELRAIPAAVRFLSLEPLLEDLGTIDLTGIDWVIVGGESGLGARLMPIEWVRSIRDQCEAAGVHFFFKQWGGLSKKRFGRELDGRTYDAMPARTP